MPAQYLDEWSPAVIIASNQVLANILDAHATEPGYLTIHDSGDVTLAVIVFDKPCGTVNQTTGLLTITTVGREENATGGTAAYATLRDGAGTAHHSMSCQAGLSPVAGKLVLSTLLVTEGSPLEIDIVEIL